MIFHIKEFYSLGIHCTEEWVSACLEWLTSDHPGLEDMEAFRLVKQQWAITDISTPGLMERFMDLQQTSVPGGQFILQVQGGYDIGSPAYGQLQKLHNVDRENARVSADDSQATQAGEPIGSQYPASHDKFFTNRRSRRIPGDSRRWVPTILGTETTKSDDVDHDGWTTDC